MCELGLDGLTTELARRLGFEEAGGGAVYLAGCRGPWLRTVVIFALIHQPILPLSRVALEVLGFESVRLRSGRHLPRREFLHRELLAGVLESLGLKLEGLRCSVRTAATGLGQQGSVVDGAVAPHGPQDAC